MTKYYGTITVEVDDEDELYNELAVSVEDGQVLVCHPYGFELANQRLALSPEVAEALAPMLVAAAKDAKA